MEAYPCMIWILGGDHTTETAAVHYTSQKVHAPPHVYSMEIFLSLRNRSGMIVSRRKHLPEYLLSLRITVTRQIGIKCLGLSTWELNYMCSSTEKSTLTIKMSTKILAKRQHCKAWHSPMRQKHPFDGADNNVLARHIKNR
ncbi:hypothetical protein RJ639_040715 [Escallonia herrerae]|uniref:Uncharacterized protein n=1 Tax=Escallonia herrerae TaxID=1293975 RepID=A0AA89ABN5_9ASTE|nr:hypothetical protein RJ639_025453 [Escallonia herrerae]KAK3025809.1 hypothetical protein RJ639_040715 [Escallonia herrerae]